MNLADLPGKTVARVVQESVVARLLDGDSEHRERITLHFTDGTSLALVEEADANDLHDAVTETVEYPAPPSGATDRYVVEVWITTSGEWVRARTGWGLHAPLQSDNLSVACNYAQKRAKVADAMTRVVDRHDVAPVARYAATTADWLPPA